MTHRPPARRELAARGYRRIGLVIDRTTDRRCGSNVYAGFLVEQELDGRLSKVPALQDYEPENMRRNDYGPKLLSYVRKHRLDAILTSDYHVLDVLRAQGLTAPEDLGVAGLSLPSADTPLSGIVEDSTRIGTVAMDMLVGMVERGERGLPPSPVRMHVEGVWHEGSTLRPLRESLAASL